MIVFKSKVVAVEMKESFWIKDTISKEVFD